MLVQFNHGEVIATRFFGNKNHTCSYYALSITYKDVWHQFFQHKHARAHTFAVYNTFPQSMLGMLLSGY